MAFLYRLLDLDAMDILSDAITGSQERIDSDTYIRRPLRIVPI